MFYCGVQSPCHMDSRPTPRVECTQKVSGSVASALVSAVHEWLLICMLFINSYFSYLVTRFAHRCQLQIPCLLCSRLDHVLGKEKPGFVWDLMCHQHKLKISSLVLCRLHKNLVDVHGTCESCFLSFATINKSNAETFRLLVGKLGDEPHYALAECSRDMRTCCCCDQQWTSRTSAQKLFHTKSSDLKKPELDSPIILTSKCIGDELQEITESYHSRINVANHLPYIGYEKVEVTSDTESEAQISDDETVGTRIHEIATSEQDSSAEHDALPEPQIITDFVYPASEKSTHSIHPRNLSLSGPDDTPGSCCKDESREPIGHGLEELNWLQADNKNDVSTPSDLISFTDPCPSTAVIGDCFDELKDYTNTSELVKEATIECKDVSKMQNESTIRTELWEEVMQSGETAKVRSDSVAANENQLDLKPYITDASAQMADSLDLGDAYRLAVGTRGRQLSGKLLGQQMSMQESKRASEDLKQLLSQLSAVRGIELSFNDNSPRVFANSEDFTSMDAPGPIGAQIFQRRISLERNESNLSVDGSPVSEIEGESTIDRLSRQVEHDKKTMSTLYKELEEEKNASAVAVNQAMAMITRLQEEKAAIHMEALQYLRMMEEQAEYDGEAFQQVNDLLVEKEKQIQDLETELEQSKNTIKDFASSSSNYLEESSLSDAGKPEEHREDSASLDNNKHDVACGTDGLPQMFEDADTRKIFMLQFENEKIFTLKSLKKLEEKLFVFTKTEVNRDMNCGEVPVTSSFEELDGPSRSNDAFMNKQVSGGLQINNIKSELDALRSEISFISKRLEALDIEHCIFECFTDSVENDEGF